MFSEERPRHTLIQVPKPPLHPALSTRPEFADFAEGEHGGDHPAEEDDAHHGVIGAMSSQHALSEAISAKRTTHPFVVLNPPPLTPHARPNSALLPYLLVVVAFLAGFALRAYTQSRSRFRAGHVAPPSASNTDVARTVNRLLSPR